MKKIVGFIKATAIGGLVVIVPLAIVIMVLAQVLAAARSVVEKLGKFLPQEWLDNPVVVLALAVLGIIGICFVIGLLLLTGPGEWLRNKVESFLEEKLPLYGMLKSLTQRLAGVDGVELAPVEVDLFGVGTFAIGFLIEKLPDGRICVFVPSSPTITVGQTYIVGRERIRALNAPTRLAVDAITQWGMGTKYLYGENAEQPDSSP